MKTPFLALLCAERRQECVVRMAPEGEARAEGSEQEDKERAWHGMTRGSPLPPGPAGEIVLSASLIRPLLPTPSSHHGFPSST